MTSIEKVKEFWNRNPLFTGESGHDPGTYDFFLEHSRIIREQIMTRPLEKRILAHTPTSGMVLDIGCGIGFWPNFFAQHGYNNIVGGDLSIESLKYASKRAELFDYRRDLVNLNAEQLPIADCSFSHVYSHGVLHHTPDIERAVDEIYRVLKPGNCL